MASALLVAGCGGGSTPTQSANSGSPPAVTTDGAGAVVAFAACMRSHGLSSYPDPQVSQSGNQVQIKISPGKLDPNAPAFKPASGACHHLLPNGGSPPSAISAAQQAQDLQFAACMRSHGVPSFPDPDHDGAFTLPAGIDQQAPQFQRAIKACKAVEPSSISILNQSPRGS